MELTPGLRRDPAPDLEAVGEDEALVARIRDEIRRDGPMPFVRFMDLALYDPAGGYYRGSEARPGRSGDFITAPEAHPIFGRAVARVLDETWRRLGEPARFVVREYGAGDGTLALAILDGLGATGRGSNGRSRTTRSRSSRAASRRSRRDWRTPGWADVLAGPATVAEPIVGAVLGNEVLDALPVHRVRRREGALVELAVGLDGERLVEVEIEPTTPALAERLGVGGHRARRRSDRGGLPRARRAGSATPPPDLREGSSCSSTTARSRPSCTTRSAGATAPSARTSATVSTTTRTGMSVARTSPRMST